jgi:hypothetical protein
MRRGAVSSLTVQLGRSAGSKRGFASFLASPSPLSSALRSIVRFFELQEVCSGGTVFSSHAAKSCIS